jgi:hypothetical protein
VKSTMFAELAWLEPLHVALGLAGGGALSSALQCLARTVITEVVMRDFEPPKHSPWLLPVLLAWTAIELVRCVPLSLRQSMGSSSMRMCALAGASAWLRVPLSYIHQPSAPACVLDIHHTCVLSHLAPPSETPLASRYPYYTWNVWGAKAPYWLKWLRYSAFMPLYPLGGFSEVCMCVRVVYV